MRFDLAYGLYMAEAENQFPDKRKQSIERVIWELIDVYNNGGSVDQSIDEVLARNHLTNATARELEYISNQFISRIG